LITLNIHLSALKVIKYLVIMCVKLVAGMRNLMHTAVKVKV